MRKDILKAISTMVVALLVASMLIGLRILPAQASPVEFKIINPGPDGYPAKWTATNVDPASIGTENFNFTGDQFGKTFFINVTVQDVTAMKGWAIGIIYDATVLKYKSAWLPTDHVFKTPADMGWTIVQPAVVIADYDATHKEVQWGCTYIMPAPEEWTFNGTGVLCQIQFEVLQQVNRLSPLLTTSFGWDPDWTSVYYHPSGSEIPTSSPGYVKIEWVPPAEKPIFYLKPSTYKASAKDEDVAIEVWVRSVSADWNIIAFQVAVWFNTTFLEPTTYETGTWLNGFVNGNESILYVAQNDFHGDPALPYCYNKWLLGAVIIPDPDTGQYVPPFPSGEGMLFRIHFKAIYETIFPVEDWTTLQVKEEEVWDMFGLHVPLGISEHCQYRAPVRTLGLDIDLYTQYTFPYGGQGKGNPSDMFGPQAEVILFARVVYNEWPVQMKLVAFEIRHGEFYIYREAYTNEDGIAMVKFRIPWPCVDPVERVFGIWDVIATVEVAEQKKNDTLSFKVWWLTEITSVKSTEDYYIQSKQGFDATFVVEYRTYRMQTIPVVLTVTVYDELGFFVGYDTFTTTVGWGEYHWCEFKNYTKTFTIHIPSNAVVGVATVYGNAYDNLPWNGGVPYCPEASSTFLIKKPGGP
jgi:hypothetical protein